MSKKKGRAFKGPDPKSLRGDACYFHRDIGPSSYGGDVNCLQQFLNRKGFLSEKPTGYFGGVTEQAVKKYQKKNGIVPADGILHLATRQLYARKQKLPVPGTEDLGTFSGSDSKKVCIDVCSEFGGVQDCETRCVRSERDKVHACKESCQIAFSAACDRAYPPSAPGGPENYKLCLKYLSQSCDETCAVYR